MAYRSLQGFVDAPWPGSSTIEVGLGPEWKAYSFAFHEGCDILAEESRYLMVLFKAAAATPDERTLCVDDIVVTKSPTTKPRLINPTTFAYAPIDHRLALGPGDRQSGHGVGSSGQTATAGIAPSIPPASPSVLWLSQDGVRLRTGRMFLILRLPSGHRPAERLQWAFGAPDEVVVGADDGRPERPVVDRFGAWYRHPCRSERK
jgi:hypothetical protein